MDLRRLEIFLHLSRNLHFSKTAEELGMVQSALSRQIGLLEKELGCRLFERSNRWNVSLTPAGTALVREAEVILQTVRDSVERVRSAARGERGTLNIALNSSALNLEILLRTFHVMSRDYPEVSLKIQEVPSRRVYEAVRNSEADAGLLRLAPVPDEDLEMRLLAEERLVMALPASHRLAGKTELFLRDFRNERFMLPGRDDAPLHRAVFDGLCRKAGFAPNVVQELESLTTILRILDSRDCVSMVPLAYQDKFEHLVFRSLSDCSAKLPESLIWRKENPSAVLKVFLSIIADF